MTSALTFWIGAAFGVLVGLVLASLMRAASREIVSDLYVPMSERCAYWNSKAFPTGKAPCGHGLCGEGSK